MAVFGKLDAKAMGTDVTVTNGDATVGTAGDFTSAADNLVKVGDILELSGVAYIVKEVTSATAIELHTTYAGSTGTVTAANAIRRTAPKAVAEYVIKGGDSASYELLFVDLTEAALDENKSRGITGPGWWQYRTFTAANGDTRHKAECLAVVSNTAVLAGDDTDDAYVADVASAVVIDVQPVAHVQAVAIQRHFRSVDEVGHEQWDDLLRELVRAIVVGAIRDHVRQTVGFPVGPDKMI